MYHPTSESRVVLLFHLNPFYKGGLKIEKIVYRGHIFDGRGKKSHRGHRFFGRGGGLFDKLIKNFKINFC